MQAGNVIGVADNLPRPLRTALEALQDTRSISAIFAPWNGMLGIGRFDAGQFRQVRLRGVPNQAAQSRWRGISDMKVGRA